MAYTLLPDDNSPSPAKYTLLPADGPSDGAVADNFMQRQTMASMVPGGQWAPDVVYGAKRALDAIAQMAAHGLSAADPTSNTAKQMAADTDAAMAGPNKPGAPIPITGSGIAEGVVPAIAAAYAAPVRAAGLAGTALQGMMAGGAGGAMEPVDNPGDNYWAQKGKQVGVGAVAGGGVAGLSSVAGKVLDPVLGAAQQKLMDSGISMTPGQALGGIADKLESKATSIPFLGDFIANARQRGVGDLNKAVYARALAPFGEEGAAVAADAPVGNDGIKAIGNFLSSKYEQALDASAPAPFTQEAQQALVKIQSMVPSAKQADFTSTIKNLVLDNLSPQGTLTPTVAKQVDSKLGSLARGYAGSQDMDQRIYGQALSQAQSEIKQMFAAANPETAPLIKAADQGWATLVQIENAGSMLGSREGVIGPAQLRNAVKKSDYSVRDRKFAQGDALNQDLADAAISVLPNKAPDSGTAGRLMQAALGGGGVAGAFANPVGTLGGLGMAGLAALPYTQLGGKATLAMLARRPQASRQLGSLLSSLAVPGAAVAGFSP